MHVELVRVIRNGFHECSHFGSVVVLRPDGSIAAELGDIRAPVFPRSSNKPFQATAMLELGADLQGADLALASASHSGEPQHTERALAMLERAGLGEDALQCPADYPMDDATREAVLRSGEPKRRIYMNCSGKHAGMLTACVKAGLDPVNYLDPEHPYQQAARDAISRLTGEQAGHLAVDGCGAPLYAVSLLALARGFSAVATADPASPEGQVGQAMRAHPELVAGTGRDDTLVMSAHPQVLMKGGAEGVHAAALTDGSAVAIKIADGAARARMPLMVAGLRMLGLDSDELDNLATGTVLGGGQTVGSVTLAPTAAESL